MAMLVMTALAVTAMIAALVMTGRKMERKGKRKERSG